MRNVALKHREMRTNLLTQANTWTSVEGKENESVVQEILLESVVEESIGIEFVRLGKNNLLIKKRDKCDISADIPSGPQRSFRRCIMRTEYEILEMLVRQWLWPNGRYPTLFWVGCRWVRPGGQGMATSLHECFR